MKRINFLASSGERQEEKLTLETVTAESG